MYQLATAVEGRQPLYGRVLSIILKNKLKQSDAQGRPWMVSKQIDIKKIDRLSTGLAKVRKATMVHPPSKSKSAAQFAVQQRG